MKDAAGHWNTLHASPRFRPAYPSEDVVRFLYAARAQLPEQKRYRFLDIGAGAGRHLRVAAELGFDVFGLDISLNGLCHARELLQMTETAAAVSVGSMTQLPFANEIFDVALAYGSFYYSSEGEMRKAIAEAHRVLTPRGRCFVVLRTTDDYRYGKGLEIGPRTFRLEIADTNELGTVQHFLSEEHIAQYFSAFANLTFEKTEWTFCGRTRLNSDWMVTALK